MKKNNFFTCKKIIILTLPLVLFSYMLFAQKSTLKSFQAEYSFDNKKYETYKDSVALLVLDHDRKEYCLYHSGKRTTYYITKIDLPQTINTLGNIFTSYAVDNYGDENSIQIIFYDGNLKGVVAVYINRKGLFRHFLCNVVGTGND